MPPVPGGVVVLTKAAEKIDVVRVVLGESYHPGGEELLRRLGSALELAAGHHLLDCVAGSGLAARQLAGEFRVQVTGLCGSQPGADQASVTAEHAGLGDQVNFTVADTGRIPLLPGTVDAILCERGLSGAADRAFAVGELAKVLRPGGRIAMLDITVDSGGLPAELEPLAEIMPGIAGAQPLEAYADLLARAGLQARVIERHDELLTRLLTELDTRLRLRRMASTDPLAAVHRLTDLTGHIAAAQQAITRGVLGYALLVVEKPVARWVPRPRRATP
ncbi:methyltransferase domain-containing protein [Pseudonocardiaceae bacterium YIM PH 21723]|nr:methyltransferase domain-containing protein [Pseudonocardiaceae bacterium YIM PH 21723]